MSKNVMINTPLYIQVNTRVLKLITFEDLFYICCKDINFFKRITAQPDKLAEILDERRLVLSYACYNALMRLLENPGAVKDALLLLRRGIWPPEEKSSGERKSKVPLASLAAAGGSTPTCIWPDCP